MVTMWAAGTNEGVSSAVKESYHWHCLQGREQVLFTLSIYRYTCPTQVFALLSYNDRISWKEGTPYTGLGAGSVK